MINEINGTLGLEFSKLWGFVFEIMCYLLFLSFFSLEKGLLVLNFGTLSVKLNWAQRTECASSTRCKNYK